MVGRLKGNVDHARDLRRNATDVESKLWRRLQSRQLHNAKFRRQVPIGIFIVDFCCLDARLIVELDGGQHADNQRDLERTRQLEKRGFEVLRFWNNEINENLEGVLETILEQVRERL